MRKSLIAVATALLTTLAAVPGGTLHFHVLQERAVCQHHREQISRRRGCVDRAFKPFGRKTRKQAAVVDVCVRQDYEVETARVERERRAIAGVSRPIALEHSAVDEEAARFGFEEETGARDFARGSTECQFHASSSGVSWVTGAVA